VPKNEEMFSPQRSCIVCARAVAEGGQIGTSKSRNLGSPKRNTPAATKYIWVARTSTIYWIILRIHGEFSARFCGKLQDGANRSLPKDYIARGVDPHVGIGRLLARLANAKTKKSDILSILGNCAESLSI
jgi:hypothetical protein